jgi:mRNA interferase RelE/StbE
MYSVILSNSAKKTLSKLPNEVVKKILDALEDLVEDPRPMGYIQLKGRSSFRIRLGNYRIIYEINDGELKIMVVEIGNRKEIYKKK